MIPFLVHSQTLEKVLKEYNKESVPYISVEELNNLDEEVIILDAREQKEYEVSHIKNAIHVGYDFFKIKAVKDQIKNKDQKIVVYCSLGIRSEDIAEKIKEVGFTDVMNLYGGIFEWKNEGHDVYDSEKEKTENVHTFNKEWSKWLLKGNKVYE